VRKENSHRLSTPTKVSGDASSFSPFDFSLSFRVFELVSCEEREETSSKTRNDKEKSKGLKLEASPETLVGVERRWCPNPYKAIYVNSQYNRAGSTVRKRAYRSGNPNSLGGNAQ
jgi:hypothetical protein